MTASVLFRIKPGIDAHTHDFVKTGQIDSKFGVALETGEALDIIKKAVKTENIEYCGIHCHIASQVFDVKPFCEAAEVMMDFIKAIKDETGADTKELNLGGGFGVAYTEDETSVDYEIFMEAVSEIIHKKAEEHGVLQYPLKDTLVDLVCEKRNSLDEKPKISLKCDKKITLEVIYNGKKEIITN